MEAPTAERDAPSTAFVHRALFHRDPDEYARITSAFIREALDGGDSVTVLAPPGRLARLADVLGEAADRVDMQDVTEVGRNPACLLPALLRASDTTPSSVLLELDWQDRRLLEYPVCVEHESLAGIALAGRPVSLLCPYDATTLPAYVLVDAAVTHPVIVDSGGERPSAGYDPQKALDDYDLPLPQPAEPPLVAHFDEPTLDDVRTLVTRRLREAGLPGERVLDAELAVNELAVNSLLYGGGGGTLRVWTDPRAAVFEISDGGRLRDPLAGRRPADPSVPGGRGIFLVHHLADLVRIRTGEDGTTIRAYFAR